MKRFVFGEVSLYMTQNGLYHRRRFTGVLFMKTYKKILLGLGLAGVASAGLGFSLVSLNWAVDQETKATTANFMRIYCYSYDGASSMIIHLWNASSNTAFTDWNSDPAMKKSESTVTYDSHTYTEYYFDVPTGDSSSALYDMVIFRANGSSQTGNLSLPGLAHASTASVNQFKTAWIMASGDTSGSWGEIGTTTFTSSWLRVWVDRNGQFATPDYKYAYHYWTSTADVEIPAKYVDIGTSSRYVCYFDVPKAVVGASYQVKFYNTSYVLQASTTTYTYVTGDNSKLYYVNYESGAFNLSKGDSTGTTQTIKAAAMADVLGGYFSCSDDKDNGYGAFKTVGETWFVKNNVWWTNGDLSAVTMDDCASQSDYSAGTKAESTDVYSKYTQMLALYNSANPSGAIALPEASVSSSLLLGIIGSAAILSTSGYLLLKKKQKEN
jgi:hypothetical protein